MLLCSKFIQDVLVNIKKKTQTKKKPKSTPSPKVFVKNKVTLHFFI